MYVKAPSCISSRIPNLSFLSQLLPGVWKGVPSKNPRWRRGCAHAPPSGKICNLFKLLIISIYVPNFSFLTQLLPAIWSPLFAIGLHWPKKWVFVFFPLDLGFLVSSEFLGIFWLNLTKSGFLRHCGFSPHFITSLLTTLNLMALKLPLWWYLFCYCFFYFAFSRFLTARQ